MCVCIYTHTIIHILYEIYYELGDSAKDLFLISGFGNRQYCEHRGCEHRDCVHRGCEHRGCEHRGCEHRGCEHRGIVRRGAGLIHTYTQGWCAEVLVREQAMDGKNSEKYSL